MKKFKVYQIHSSTGTELAGFEFESKNMETAQASAVKIARNDHGWFGYTNKRGSRTWTPTATEDVFYNEVDCETIYIKEIKTDSTPNPEGTPNVPSNNEETITMADTTTSGENEIQLGVEVVLPNGNVGLVVDPIYEHPKYHDSRFIFVKIYNDSVCAYLKSRCKIATETHYPVGTKVANQYEVEGVIIDYRSEHPWEYKHPIYKPLVLCESHQQTYNLSNIRLIELPAKPDGNEESVIIKPEVETDSKPKTTDKNVARKDGKVVGNLEELTDKVLKAKRENPKLSWVKLINSLQLLRQDGYKIRRSSYFQNQLTENEKGWALKSTAK